MKKISFIFVFIFIGLFFISGFHGAKLQEVKNPGPQVLPQKLKSTAAVKPDINFGKIPLYFISNKGQVHKQAKFYAKASKYTLWLTKEGLVFDSTKKTEDRSQKSEGRIEKNSFTPHPKFKFSKQKKRNTFQRPNASTFQREVSRLMFLGANNNPEITPINETKLKVNYFKGNDPSKWVGDIPTSQAVLYKKLYKNIDLKVYGIEKQIEYDWIVKPGGNPEDIRFEYKNVKNTKIDKKGNLVIQTKFGELIHKKPISYQFSDEARGREDVSARERNDMKLKKSIKQEVKVVFKKISNNTYGFDVGEYDKNIGLIIDPIVLAYSTYLGGNNADYGYSIAVDSSGYVYVSGSTQSGNFPVLNQYMSNQDGSTSDAFVTKLDTNQGGVSSLIYSTYLGGGDVDSSNGIAVDNIGHAYVTGKTESTDFPCLNQYMSDPGDSLEDVFVTMLDTTQSGVSSLIYSTYLGGNDWDVGKGIAVDSSGYTYITGHTNSTNYPIVNQYQNNQGADDVFVTKLDTTQSGPSSLLYSTYLGGDEADEGHCIAVDSSEKAYVSGYTASTFFPVKNQYQSLVYGTTDVFVTKLDTTQSGSSSLLYSTYLGGSSADFGFGIAADNNGYAYVTGDTHSTNFPTLNQYMTDPGDNSYDVFVTKLDTTLSGSFSLLYSTYLGGGAWDSGLGIAVDNSGYVYITGYSVSTNFPILNYYQTHQGSADVIVAKMNPKKNGDPSLIYSTYLGGSGIDFGRGIAVDSSGNAYVTGQTDSSNFPCLGQFQSNQPNNDILVSKLIDLTYHQHPVVVTKSISSVTATSAFGGGRVIAEGETAVTVRGVCWSTTSNPTIWDAHTIDGSGLGDYTSSLTGLAPDTTYYLRAYAANDELLAYGEERIFTTLPPPVTVTYPNGGETWVIGSTENITWIPNLLPGEQVKISLIKSNGVFLKTIADNISADLGSHAVYISASVLERDYRIKIEVNGLMASDESDASFSVTSPFITLTAPNGGENWQVGTTENITWDSGLLPGDLIKIVLLKTNGRAIYEIANNLDPTTGTFAWNIPSNLPVREYLIKIKVKNKAISDTSDSAFSVHQ